jgi:hypothetical protein
VRVCSRLPSVDDRHWYLLRHSLSRRRFLVSSDILNAFNTTLPDCLPL